jgi:ATP-dependent Lon protease
MSMILMFDEVDKISTTPKGEEVQNLLIHLTDPVQNAEFEDKYLAGVPIDLSRVMFTFSANYLERIDKVLLDRMTVVKLNGYNLKDKVAIAEHYLLPNALKELGLAEKVGINKEVLTHIVETYANEETGVRELKRCIEQIAQKINMLRMFNSKQLPFHIKDFTLPFVMKKEHVDLFLKKKEAKDASIAHLYT